MVMISLKVGTLRQRCFLRSVFCEVKPRRCFRLRVGQCFALSCRFLWRGYFDFCLLVSLGQSWLFRSLSYCWLLCNWVIDQPHRQWLLCEPSDRIQRLRAQVTFLIDLSSAMMFLTSSEMMNVPGTTISNMNPNLVVTKEER
jgi:hypothetical protein